MSLLEPGLHEVRTLADHPFVDAGAGRDLRMVATGSITAGRFGRMPTAEELAAIYARHDQVMVDV
jgi:hypothetical protein